MGSSLVARPMVMRQPDSVGIDPVLGSHVQARQSWACVYTADRQLGNANYA
jgi:hypothetical protein